MAKGNGHAKRTPPKYRVFKLTRDERDPSMDDLYALARNEGVSDEQLHVMSGVSVSTFKNWWGPKAKTRRPTHVCLAATAGALGFEYVLTKRRTINIDEELIAGQKWLDRFAKKEK